jgi:glucokinase
LALDRPFRREYVSCGCFEHHASGEGLAKVAKELLAQRGGKPGRRSYMVTTLQGCKGLTARDVFAAFDRGDPVATEVIAQAVGFWGMAVANLVSLFNPEKIIFGGGVFGPASKLLGDIYAEAKKWAQPISIKQVKLQPSKLGGDAGLYGAGRLALQTQSADSGSVRKASNEPETSLKPPRNSGGAPAARAVLAEGSGASLR